MSVKAWRATTSRLFNRRSLVKTDSNARVILDAAFFDPIHASAVVTEATDAVAITATMGASANNAALAVTEAADTVAITATFADVGALAVTESADTIAIAATVADAAAFALQYHGALTTLGLPFKARAGVHVGPVTLREARTRLDGEGRPVLLVFGTGWGLADEVIAGADALLEPVRAREATGYNHLSVRAACAILLDRRLGA